MIGCKQAKQLFNAYADGGLPPSWMAELHAHQVQCQACRRELTLMRVCGDIIASDRREPSVSADFSDRVLAGFSARRRPMAPWHRRFARMAVGVGTAAAAAVVAVAILLPLRTPEPTTRVLGMQVAFENVVRDPIRDFSALSQVSSVLLHRVVEHADEAVQDVFRPGDAITALWGSQGVRDIFGSFLVPELDGGTGVASVAVE